MSRSLRDHAVPRPMKFYTRFALCVFVISVLSRDVLSFTTCPDTCLADDQVLYCKKLKGEDLYRLATCLHNNKIVVIDLTYSGISCDCTYLDVSSYLLYNNILVVDVVACASHSIQTCLANTTAANSEQGSSDVYQYVFGALFSVQSAGWRTAFNRHYYRLWSLLSTIKAPSVRQFYLTILRGRSRSALRWMDVHTADNSTGHGTHDGNQHHPLNSKSPTSAFRGDVSRMTKILIFSTITGLLILLIVVFLLCKLEQEQKHLKANTRQGDLWLENKVQSRLCSWQAFIEKFSNYKRQKADRNSDTDHGTGKQMFIEMKTIDTTGGIYTQEHGPAAAVSSLTRLVEQQPLESPSQCNHDTSASRTSISSQRFEPLGVSSRETTASH